MGNNTEPEAKESEQKSPNACSDKVQERFKSTIKSTQNSSSFERAVDPREQFRRDIQRQCNFGTLPPMCMQHRFSFYVWESGIGLGHDSVVVGSAERDGAKYGYFTVELVVDEAKHLATPTVIPTTQFISPQDGAQRVAKRKWEKQFELDTTIDQLIILDWSLLTNTVLTAHCTTAVSSL